MSLPAWTFNLDHAQNRFSRLRIGVALGGLDLYDKHLSTDTYIEPVTNGLILCPVAEYAAWNTSNSGAYAKLSKTDFGSPAGITEVDQSGTGARKFLTGAAGIALQTTATWAINSGAVLELLTYSNGANGVLVEGGWSNSSSLASDTGFEIMNDLSVRIYRDGDVIATGKLSGAKASGTNQNATLRIYLMPHRVRELLIWSNGGDGFAAIMPDIDESDTSPEITPAAKFWVRQPDVSTNILVAPLRFATSGVALSTPYVLAEAPDGTDVYEEFDNKTWAGGTGQEYRIYGDASYRTGHSDSASCTMVTASGAAFSPDGTNRNIRLKNALSGDGLSTPMIYGAEMGFAGREAVTDDSEQFDVTDFVTEFSISVPDQGGPTANLTIRCAPEVMAGVAKIKKIYNRPAKIALGEIDIFNGRLSAPKWKHESKEEVERIPFDVVTTIQALKDYRVRDLKPFDGMYITRASGDCLIRWCAKQVGVPDAALDLEDSDVRLGEIAPKVCGEWAEYADVGASLWEVMTRVMEDYLGGWFMDVVPTATNIKLKVCSQATLEAADPVYQLFWTPEAAILAGIDPELVWRHAERTRETEVVKPESNEVVVTGQDPRTGLGIGAVKRDYDAQDPTLAPSARGDNWSGQPEIFGLINSGISTQALADDAALVIAAKLFVARTLDPIQCEFMIRDNGVPVWRGDNITIDGETFMVQTLSAEAVSIAEGFEWMPAQYVLSNLIGSTGGMTAADIAAKERVKRRNKLVQRRNSIGLAAARRGGIVVVA